jgi:hypothetical protein
MPVAVWPTSTMSASASKRCADSEMVGLEMPVIFAIWARDDAPSQ